MVTFLSKYFSKAKENKNKEKIEIKTDGINVNKPKYVIYFLLELNPSLSISFFIALLISIKIKTKSAPRRIISRINKISYSKLHKEKKIKNNLLNTEILSPIKNFYMTDSVSRSSPIMSECSLNFFSK